MKRLLFIAPLIFLSSCATVQTTSQKPLMTQEQIKEELLGDLVPVYPGFRLVPDKSFIYESGNIKVGRLYFVGDAKLKDLVSYYRETLPDKGWEPVAITIYGNIAELTYTTAQQFLQITIKKGFSQTSLIIQVGPRGELTNSSQ